MITSITIRKTATYPDSETVIDQLGRQCIFFGDNGSGKTTISRVIAAPRDYPTCSIIPALGDTMVQVYNRDFVEQSYRETGYPGVFALGATAKAIEDRIDVLRSDESELTDKVVRFRSQIDSTNQEQKDALKVLTDLAWQERQNLDDSLEEALTGTRKHKANFVDKLLRLTPARSVKSRDTLLQEAEVLFGEAPDRRALLTPLNAKVLVDIEAAEEWGTVLIAGGNAPLAALIARLGHGDWVRKGIPHLDEADCCPFCQKPTPEGLRESLKQVFDKTYEDGLTRLRQLRVDYDAESRALEAGLDKIEGALRDSMGLELGRLRTILAENRSKMQRKIDAQGEPVVLENTSALVQQAEAAIEAQNAQSKQWNSRLDNRKVESAALTVDVWQYLLSRVTTAVNDYHRDSSSRRKKLDGLTNKLEAAQVSVTAIRRELGQLQAKLTSVEGAVEKINGLLRRFGFSGFRLSVSADRRHYELARDDGQPVGRTLSEGEKTLVSFLYFFQLAQGGLSESETGKKRILVVDDPISSLDANVLFMVSTLVREMLSWALDEKHLVEQVIVLTHNAYFHKEVSTERGDGTVVGAKHWLVRKIHGVSRIERCDRNPVCSTYGLLWRSIRAARDGDVTDCVGLANAMRRVLESYFHFAEGGWSNGLRKMHDGEDLAVVKALISWTHDGSHNVFDGLEISPGHTMEQYLKVFERIFRASGHEKHYEMMMDARMS